MKIAAPVLIWRSGSAAHAGLAVRAGIQRAAVLLGMQMQSRAKRGPRPSGPSGSNLGSGGKDLCFLFSSF